MIFQKKVYIIANTSRIRLFFVKRFVTKIPRYKSSNQSYPLYTISKPSREHYVVPTATEIIKILNFFRIHRNM